jgi:L-fucose isomerase-like protein
VRIGLTSPKIGFVTCAHPIYKLPSVVQHENKAISGLRAAGCDVISPGMARNQQDTARIVEEFKKEKIDLLLFFFCTWIAEEITLSIAQQLESAPLLLWALPYLDLSKPMPSPMTGITATGCNLKLAGRQFLHRVGGVTSEGIREIVRTARVAAAVARLRQARFGIFGSACPGMLDTECDEASLENKLGCAAIHFDIESLRHARDAGSAREAGDLARQLRNRVGRCEVELETVESQFRLHLGMQALVREHGLDGISVRCWPELRDQDRTLACLSKSVLSEAGLATACEADLTALVTSYVLTSISGRPNCTLEITAYLEEQNAIQLAHCGMAAMSMGVDPSRAALRPHMRTGEGALVEFELKSGPVTIAKLLRPSGASLRLFLGRGEIIPTRAQTRGTVATVRVEPSPAQFLRAMLDNAVEHHLVIAHGDWTGDLMQFAQFTKMEIITPVSPPQFD